VDLGLGGYQLQYFNNNDLTKATSSKILPLSGILPPQSYYMLSDGASTICYQVTVSTVSLGFSTTSGFAEIVQLPPQTAAGNLVVPTVVDYVGWSKKTSGGNDTITVSPAATSVTVQTGITSASVSWMRQLPVQSSGVGSWLPVRPDPKNACALQLVQSGTAPTQPIANPGNQLKTGQQPPATIVNLASADSDSESAPQLPTADVGLAAPQITELLPNPVGSGNDDTDEFIELYNPNAAAFDLSGFTLQTGTTTKHSYEFPDETILPPQSFTAFYSTDTGLSLSNTSGQSDLADPFGNLLSQTEAYGTAKDGQTWSLADSKWYWTTQATPNAANIIKQPVVAKSSSKTSKSSKTTASTSNATSGTVKGATTSSSGTSAPAASDTKTTPIHPLVLAAIGILAVGYGVYEYRHDIANKFYEFRRNRRLGRAARV
jgi:hypothetical protein